MTLPIDARAPIPLEAPPAPRLRVRRARWKDVLRGRLEPRRPAIVRVSESVMASLGLLPGDVVTIEGERPALARVGPLRPANAANASIHMDRRLRSAAGVRLDAPVGIAPQTVTPRRRVLSDRYLSGNGLELGALHAPLPVAAAVQVTHVDRMPLEELRRHYPELNGVRIVDPDVVDNGETLSKFSDNSQDFVIANHFLEHCEDPLGALQTFFRVLRPGGVLYAAIPNKHQTFDRDRPTTPFEHLLDDHRQGPERSRRDHYIEFARFAELKGQGDEETVLSRAAKMMEMSYSIHFHAWTPEAMQELFLRAPEVIGYRYEVLAALTNLDEVVFVLRKTEPA